MDQTRFNGNNLDSADKIHINSSRSGQTNMDFRSLSVQQSGQGRNDAELSQFVPLQQTAWRTPLRNTEQSVISDDLSKTSNLPYPPPPRNPPPIPSHQGTRKGQIFPSYRTPNISAPNEKYPFGVPPIPPRVQINRYHAHEPEAENYVPGHYNQAMSPISRNLNTSFASVNTMNSSQLQSTQNRRYFSGRSLFNQEQRDNTRQGYNNSDPRNDPEYQLKIRADFSSSSPQVADFIPSPDMKMESGAAQDQISQTQKISRSPELTSEEKAQRNSSILAQLPIIQQNEPLKSLVITILLDGRAHTETDLLRTLKKHGKYIGSVALGMLIYHMIEIFGADMIERTFPSEEAVYKISDRFQRLCKQVFPSNLPLNSNSTSNSN